MSPTAAPAKTKAARETPLRQPPDERFWVRYSPHHEFPVGLAGSVLVHGIGFGLLALVLIGALAGLFGKHKPVEVEPIEYLQPGGGGGHKQGIGDGPGSGVLPHGKEAEPPDTKRPLVSIPKTVQAPNLRDIDKTPPQLKDVPPDAATARAIPEESTDAVLGQLSDIGKQARQKIDGIIAGRGKGGTGSGGGQGAGTGTGQGNLEGPGGLENKRTRRQQRWVMIFNTSDGADYLRQLQHLGAIVAMPQPGGGYLVFRDLSSKPLKGVPEDIGTINRIYWVDDKPHSVESLARAMGIFPAPPYLAAFFPESMEKELRNKEELHYRGNEDNIEETRFQVVRRGTRYEPIVVARPRLKGQ